MIIIFILITDGVGVIMVITDYTQVILIFTTQIFLLELLNHPIAGFLKYPTKKTLKVKPIFVGQAMLPKAIGKLQTAETTLPMATNQRITNALLTLVAMEMRILSLPKFNSRKILTQPLFFHLCR